MRVWCVCVCVVDLVRDCVSLGACGCTRACMVCVCVWRDLVVCVAGLGCMSDVTRLYVC